MMTTVMKEGQSARSTAPSAGPGQRRALNVGLVGVGYVGLPLALALGGAGHSVRAYDTDRARRQSATDQASAAGLSRRSFRSVARIAGLAECDVFVITVPTPTADGRPDLRHVEAACSSVGSVLRPGALVVLESTVAPGTTRGVCLPILERASGLQAGRDFHLAYSPERINPGDSEHRLTEVVKVVAGLDKPSVEAAVDLYSHITDVHVAANLEVAELAKLVENAQRDVNIAFVNEVSTLAAALGLRTSDVLAVAATKWNFVDFTPGIVGGHCIAEDPYYLMSAAADRGVDVATVRAARATNEQRAERIADIAASLQRDPADGAIVIYGATYKPNVPDRRNSAASQLAEALSRRGYRCRIIDPLVDGHTAFQRERRSLSRVPTRLVIATVVHDAFADVAAQHICSVLQPDGAVLDLTGRIDAAGFSRFQHVR